MRRRAGWLQADRAVWLKSIGKSRGTVSARTRSLGVWGRAIGLGAVALVVFALIVVAALKGPSIWAGHVPSSSPSASSPASAGASATPPQAGIPAARTVTATIDEAKLDAAIASVTTPRLGTITGEVLDMASGRTLYASGATSPMMPASSQKVLTTTSVLDALGPGHRFTTSVVRSGSTITLVGGGDPYLASRTPASLNGKPSPPTLAALADATAKALLAAKVTTVRLDFDDSLFSGPGWQSSWPVGYRDQVTTVSSLWVDEGETAGARSLTPAQDAAAIFADQLRARHIQVVGAIARAKAPAVRILRRTPSPSRGASSASPVASVVASIKSWPLSTIVEQTLLHSDNSAAEVLLRQLAIASGKPASFDGGVQALDQHLRALGLWDSSARLVDGSGLSRDDRVSANMLTRAIRLDNATPKLYPVLNGLPVAGITGTLQSRFYLDDAAPARGVAHAKTGTLTHVSTYTGWTTTAGGGVVAYAFLINGAAENVQDTGTSVGTNDWNMRNHLDLLLGAITGCGCS